MKLDLTLKEKYLILRGLQILSDMIKEKSPKYNDVTDLTELRKKVENLGN